MLCWCSKPDIRVHGCFHEPFHTHVEFIAKLLFAIGAIPHSTPQFYDTHWLVNYFKKSRVPLCNKIVNHLWGHGEIAKEVCQFLQARTSHEWRP